MKLQYVLAPKYYTLSVQYVMVCGGDFETKIVHCEKWKDRVQVASELTTVKREDKASTKRI